MFMPSPDGGFDIGFFQLFGDDLLDFLDECFSGPASFSDSRFNGFIDLRLQIKNG